MEGRYDSELKVTSGGAVAQRFAEFVAQVTGPGIFVPAKERENLMEEDKTDANVEVQTGTDRNGAECSSTTIFDRGDDDNCPLKLIVCRVGFGSPFLGFEKGFCFPPAFRAWGWSEGVARTGALGMNE